MGDHLLDFVGNPANATFGGSGGFGDEIPSSPDSAEQGKVSLDMLHRLRSQLCYVQLVTLGRSQE